VKISKKKRKRKRKKKRTIKKEREKGKREREMDRFGQLRADTFNGSEQFNPFYMNQNFKIETSNVKTSAFFQGFFFLFSLFLPFLSS